MNDATPSTVPRCQHVQPTPWGLAQCCLPEHKLAGRHAFSPSEGPAELAGVPDED